MPIEGCMVEVAFEGVGDVVETWYRFANVHVNPGVISMLIIKLGFKSHGRYCVQEDRTDIGNVKSYGLSSLHKGRTFRREFTTVEWKQR